MTFPSWLRLGWSWALGSFYTNPDYRPKEASMDMSLRQCQFTSALAKLIVRINAAGFDVKVQELNRELATQRQYVTDGVSKTMDSRHLDKLAADLILFKDGVLVADQNAYRQFGEYWETLGGRWGGRFVDLVGFKEKHGRDFDMAVDLGWDPDHFEFRKA